MDDGFYEEFLTAKVWKIKNILTFEFYFNWTLSNPDSSDVHEGDGLACLFNLYPLNIPQEEPGRHRHWTITSSLKQDDYSAGVAEHRGQNAVSHGPAHGVRHILRA